jgi:hypothetical protein
MPFGKVNTPSLQQANPSFLVANTHPSHAWVELSKHVYQRALTNRTSGYWISLVFSFLVLLTVSYVVSSPNKSWDSKENSNVSSLDYAKPEPAQVSKERASNF